MFTQARQDSYDWPNVPLVRHDSSEWKQERAQRLDSRDWPNIPLVRYDSSDWRQERAQRQDSGKILYGEGSGGGGDTQRYEPVAPSREDSSFSIFGGQDLSSDQFQAWTDELMGYSPGHFIADNDM